MADGHVSENALYEQSTSAKVACLEKMGERKNGAQ